jgi:tryptophanyl-tRNA synthetase
MKIFSAVRPSGELQLGNYFGAINQWVDLQLEHESVFAVADYHAITTDFKPKNLHRRQTEFLSYFLASGLDPERSIIFIQSQNPDHTELAWILSSIAKEAELERMTQYKEKKEKEKLISAGLLTYPILQAADILLYQTELVPVGEDQVQHIEFARLLARQFNNRFGSVFIEPKVKLVKEAARIMSLTDPASKMSKSGPDRSKINLGDSPQKATDKIRSAVTDSGQKIRAGKDKPALTNLLTIYSLLSKKSVQKIETDYCNKGYAEFKESLAELTSRFLVDLQKKRETVIEKRLVEGATKRGLVEARKISSQTLGQAKRAIGVL